MYLKDGFINFNYNLVAIINVKYVPLEIAIGSHSDNLNTLFIKGCIESK